MFHLERVVLRLLALVVAAGSLVFAVTKTTVIGLSDGGFTAVAGGSGFTIAFLACSLGFTLAESYSAVVVGRLIQTTRTAAAAAATAAASQASTAAGATTADGAPSKKIKIDRATLARLFGLAKPEWKLLTIGMIALVLSSITQLGLPFIFGVLVDALGSTDNPYENLIQAVVVLVIISAVGSFFSFIRGWTFTLAGQRVMLLTHARCAPAALCD